ncbi:MAG: NifB/NifX family molybdenum-iron cluster-binding protein, partial [Desulfobacteraceae bacterium]
VLDTATRILVVDSGGQENVRFVVDLQGDDIVRRCARIEKLEVGTLICSAVSNPFHQRLLASNIQVIQGISGTVEDVLEAYLQGDLFQEAFLMPGCRKGRQGRCTGPARDGRGCENRRGKERRRRCRQSVSNPQNSEKVEEA